LRIRADEHVSEEIVHAVRQMVLSPGIELSHIIEVGSRGAGDVPWVSAFANEGGDAILSGDNDFLDRHQQVMAVHDAGLKIIHMPHKWCNAKCHLQAAFMLTWWRRIEAKLAECGARECWRPPWNINESGDLMKVTIDYQRARKKVKKATANSAA
jgi:hypothetical protein